LRNPDKFGPNFRIGLFQSRQNCPKFEISIPINLAHIGTGQLSGLMKMAFEFEFWTKNVDVAVPVPFIRSNMG
jgi:hypothetical protein